jgi:catechol 2,3-dioxygenase-like lactoylglutathione lyase family enzyme
MADAPPILNQLDIVARDLDASIAFYRQLGLEIPESKVWRTATGAHHVDLDLPNGFVLHIDSAALAKHFDTGWRDGSDRRGRVVIGFSLPSREAVDARFAELVAAGYAPSQPPHDTFWGARYAVIEDPDGNPVGLMSPLDRARAGPPPAL